MTFRLIFVQSAQKEWRKIGATIQQQFKKKLGQRLEHPRVPGDRLHGSTNRYKIKLRASGYRLVYDVFDEQLIVEVVAVGKREHGSVYLKAAARTGDVRRKS